MVSGGGAVGGIPAMIDAASLIGVVLLEAIVLYVGYGAAEQALGNQVVERLKNK
jgi:hypothetical protein